MSTSWRGLGRETIFLTRSLTRNRRPSRPKRVPTLTPAHLNTFSKYEVVVLVRFDFFCRQLQDCRKLVFGPSKPQNNRRFLRHAWTTFTCSSCFYSPSALWWGILCDLVEFRRVGPGARASSISSFSFLFGNVRKSRRAHRLESSLDIETL